jgi:hypothetical protein
MFSNSLIRRGLAAVVLLSGLGAVACSKSVTGLVLSYLIVRGADQSGEAGTALGPIVVRVTDSHGNPHAGTRLSANPRTGGSVSPPEVTTGANGEATFAWTLGAALGGHELLVEDLGSSSSFSVYAVARQPAVASIAITPTSAALAAGETEQFAAIVRDAQSRELTGRVITWSSSTPSVASVTGFAGLVTGVGGGSTTITATSESRSASATVTVASGPPTQLFVTTEPGGAADGNVFTVQPVVEVRDAQGGVAVSTAPVPVTVAIQSGPGVLTGTTTALTVNGVATFGDLRIAGVGVYTLIFTSPGLAAATTISFLVEDAANAGVVVTTLFLSNATEGMAYGVVLAATGGTGAYVWSLASGSLPAGITLSPSGVLSGTPTAPGTSTFTVRATSGDASGERALTLTVVPSGGGGGGSGQPPTHLTVGAQPAGAVSGAAFTTQPTVVVRSAGGGAVTSPSVPVTASIATGPGTLSGNTTVSAVNGVVNFTNLQITGPGFHSLAFSSPGLTGAISAPFNVAAAGGGGTAGLNVGAATPESVAEGADISVPIILDMSTSGGGNVASIQFTVSWDMTKFDFVSGTVNGGSGFTLTPNTSDSAFGSVSVAGFAVTGVTTTTTLYTIVLTARAGTGGSSTTVTGTVGAAADQLGVAVTITPRNLVVNITS